MWICTGSAYSEKTQSCEHCSHGINNLFFIHNAETNCSMVVGSDCVLQFCTVADTQSVNVKLLERRITRAGRQWRENKPAKLEGESREQYVNRRVAEMANAMKAFNAWMAIFNRQNSIWTVVRKRLQAKNIVENHENFQAEQKAFYAEFESHWKANSFDFNRPIWDVKKI